MPSKYNLRLTKPEKNLLFRKYTLMGMDYEQARNRIKNIVDYLEDFIEKLKSKKLPDKTIHEKFLEEFAKLCESEE